MKTKFLALSAVAAIALAAPAQAKLKINLIDDGTVAGTKAQEGFRIAAAYWESVLTSDAVINFNVGFDHLGPNVLGSTGSTLSTYVPISAYQGALAAKSNSALDAVAVAHLSSLSATGSLNVTVPDYYDTLTKTGVANAGSRIAPDGSEISNTMALTTANLKALVGTGNAGLNAVVDGTIKFSSDFAFDFNPADGIDAGKSDFIGVAIHEMGHALGFISAADDFDYSAGGQGFPTDEYWWGYGLDMFRYSAPGKLDWTFGTDSYFSIDGGATQFNGKSGFSTGENNGDGWQASHWKAPQVIDPATGELVFSCAQPKIGIMNPYLCSGRKASVTGTDLALFDAIGWNTNVDVLANPNYSIDTGAIKSAFVPEPAQWALMIGGFGFVGGAMRRRKAKVSVTFA
jgi:hypothetical protein